MLVFILSAQRSTDVLLVALQRGGGGDSGGNKRLWRRNYNKQSKMLCKPEVLTGDAAGAAPPTQLSLGFVKAQLSNHLLLPLSLLPLSPPSPPRPHLPVIPASRSFFFSSSPSDRAKRDPREEKERFVELDPAVLDIIHSVLARRRRVKPVKLPGFYRRLQSQQPQARGSLAPRAWNIHHKALPLSCGETCTSAQHADCGVDRMAICEDTRESWSTQRNAAPLPKF